MLTYGAGLHSGYWRGQAPPWGVVIGCWVPWSPDRCTFGPTIAHILRSASEFDPHRAKNGYMYSVLKAGSWLTLVLVMCCNRYLPCIEMPLCCQKRWRTESIGSWRHLSKMLSLSGQQVLQLISINSIYKSLRVHTAKVRFETSAATSNRWGCRYHAATPVPVVDTKYLTKLLSHGILEPPITLCKLCTFWKSCIF